MAEYAPFDEMRERNTSGLPASFQQNNSGRATPPWSNVNLPRQYESTIGQTAQFCRNQPTSIPENPFFAHNDGSKRAREDERPYLEPLEGQTALVYSAYLAHRVVTVPMTMKDVEALVEAEREELLTTHGAGRGMRDLDAAEPRQFALTLLVSELATPASKRGLLDSMALLARLGSRPCAAGCVRLSALAHQQAQRYSIMQGAGALRYPQQLALVYVGDEGALHCEIMEIEYKDTNKKIFTALRKTVAALFEEVNRDPPPALSTSLKLSSELVTDAYVRTMAEANALFWEKLSTHTPMPPLDYKLSFQELQIFLKIAAHQFGNNLGHVHVFFGMLLYRVGMEREASDFVIDALTSERDLCPDAPMDHPLGLRYPHQSNELAIGLHVLQCTSDLGAQFKGEISAYGLIGVPGAQVCLHKGGLLPRLVFSLRPFCAEAMRGLFVFPCTQDQVDTVNEWTTRAQWDAAELGVRKYWEHFLDDSPVVTPVIPAQLPQDVSQLSDEERALVRMVGAPLASGYKVGDVHGAIVRLNYDLPVLKSFLLWAMARCGPNASMGDALAKCVQIENEHKGDMELLKAQLEAQADEMASAKCDALLAERSARAAAPSPPPPARELHPGRCEPVVAGKLLKAMGLTGGVGFRLEMPMTGGRITAIVTVCQRALGVAEDKEAAAWGKRNCAEMDQITAIGAVARNLVAEEWRIFVMVVNGQVVDFDEFIQVDDRVERHSVPVQDAIKASLEPTGSFFLKYDEEAKKLFPLVKG